MKQEVIDRRIREAASQNCEYLGAPSGEYKETYQYCSYKFPCGHIQDVKRVHFNAKKYRCRTCLINKHENRALDHGTEIIDHRPNDDADYKLYKLACGHTKLIASYNINKSASFCESCDTTARHLAAERNNLELLNLEDATTWMSRLYKFKDCGHIQSILLSKVTNDNVPSCSACQKIRWQKEAEAVGAELLEMWVEKTDTGISKHNYRLVCGCIKAVSTGCIRTNGFGCDKHSAYWKMKAVMYCIEITTPNLTWLKVGVSSKLAKRVSDYKIKSDYSYEILKEIDYESLAEATRFEKQFHKKYKDLRLNPDSMKLYKDNGTTECYPLSMSQQILEELSELSKDING